MQVEIQTGRQESTYHSWVAEVLAQTRVCIWLANAFGSHLQGSRNRGYQDSTKQYVLFISADPASTTSFSLINHCLLRISSWDLLQFRTHCSLGVSHRKLCECCAQWGVSFWDHFVVYGSCPLKNQFRTSFIRHCKKASDIRYDRILIRSRSPKTYERIRIWPRRS